MEERDKKKPQNKKTFPSAQCESGNDLDYDVDIYYYYTTQFSKNIF